MGKRYCEICGKEETKKTKVFNIDNQFICQECLDDMAADYESNNYDIGDR